MKNVNIYLVKPLIKKPLSELIMGCEHTNYSHVVVSWYIESLQRHIYYEATGSGVNFISKYNFDNEYKVVKIYEFNISNLIPVAQFCHDNSGNKYGLKGLFGLSLMRFLRLFKIKIANPFKDGKYSQICLETGALVLATAGAIDLPEDIEDYGLIEFEHLLIKYGKRVV